MRSSSRLCGASARLADWGALLPPVVIQVQHERPYQGKGAYQQLQQDATGGPTRPHRATQDAMVLPKLALGRQPHDAQHTRHGADA